MSAFTTSGKIAIITGGTKGIGRAAAQRLVRDGAKVMLNYSSDSAAADAVVAELGADNAAVVQADAGSTAGIDKIVAATVERWGRIDIVVANAGLLLMRTLADTTPEDFTRIFAVNVQGPYFLAQKAVPHMTHPDGGRIVFLSTSVCKNSAVTPNYLLYTATKGAIEQMTRIIAKELGPKRIAVNAVAPGPTATELFYQGKPEQLVKSIEAWHPQGRIGRPDEMADVIAFASGPGAQWVSGQTIYANGGAIV